MGYSSLARRALWGALAGIATIVAGLLIAEASLRAFGLSSPFAERSDYVEGLHAYDFIDRPGVKWRFTVNADGFRAPVPTPKKPGELRIVVLGDSHVWGTGISDDERLTHHLEVGLRADGLPATVFNLALSNMTYRHFARMVAYARRYEPDLVIVVSYLGNDPGEAFLRTWRRIDGHIAPGIAEHIKRYFRKWHLTALAMGVLRRREIEAAGAEEKPCGFPRPMTENGGRYSQFLEQHCWFQREPERLREALETMDRDIRGIGWALADHGLRGMLAILPSSAAMGLGEDREGFELTARRMGVDPAIALDTEARLAARLERLGSAHLGCMVDLGTVLRLGTGAPEHYFRTDWHVTPLGQKAIAGLLQEVLTRSAPGPANSPPVARRCIAAGAPAGNGATAGKGAGRAALPLRGGVVE